MDDRIISKESANKNEPTEAAQALYEAARPSVGNIVASHYDKGKQVMGSAGSGFFVRSSADGEGVGQCEMVTDNHVIHIDDKLKVELEVTLNDGSKHKANILKQDAAHDLAFIKVLEVTDPVAQCKPLTISDEQMQVGDEAVRLNRTRWDPEFKVGSFQRTGKRKDQELPELGGEDKNRDFLIFDTYNSLGHQYSGGPYVDKTGKVVAIHEGGQSSDISLATPARDLKEQLDLLHQNKS